ncbi:MAG TPA: glycosyltransferase family 4 protein [Chitinophagaceae bacterium]|jgi:glycosyltransferase involved in cell wall biosynthesis|nr:glycosyltransferase family 4 protein [Chitinophagaceae bacterium]
MKTKSKIATKPGSFPQQITPERWLEMAVPNHKTLPVVSKKILVGIPPINHIVLAFDEINGVTELGYTCQTIVYGTNSQNLNKIKRFQKVVTNAFKIVKKLYQFKPHFLYLNSRFEPLATSRDFVTMVIVRLLYFRPVKVVIKSHGSDLSILTKEAFLYKKIIVPFMLKQVNAWFFLSNEEKETILVRNKEMWKRSYVTTNIIDPARSVPSEAFRKKYGLDTGKFRLLYVGRMVKEKGIFDIIRTIPLLSFKDDCVFVFVGDGTDFKELKSFTEEQGLSAYVQFTGFVKDEQCDHFYANTDLLVYPTYDTEGFPMALFKSVAAGLPVVTTQIRAAKDHLTGGKHVLWVEAKSSPSIAAAITELYHNRALISTMSENNKMLGKKFSRKNVCVEMDQNYFGKSFTPGV